DFQHALHCKEAVEAGRDAYVEKPFAETMEDNKAAREAVEESGKIVQIGSQRRSGSNYHAANKFIREGKFGDIVMVEMSWNVNQPNRWRLPQLTKEIQEKDTDWKRYLMNRLMKNGTLGNILNTDSSGLILQAFPVNGCPTKSILYIGLPA